LRVTGYAHSLRRSTTATAFIVAMVVSLLPGLTLAANNNLLNGQVAPTSGTTATPFAFRVDYVGAPVNSVSVRLSGVGSGVITLPLSLLSGTDTDGTYGATTTLDADSWTVRFEADASTQNDPVENWGTLVVSPQATPTPDPTATPAPPTPRPTTLQTPRPTAPPNLAPGATPRPGLVPPPAGTPASGGTSATPATTAAAGSALPSATGATLAGNPTPGSSERGGNVEASGTADPNAVETSDTESSAGVGRVVMLAVGGTLAVSGAGYLAVLSLRRRGRLHGGHP
jgi:hypothetical protein